MRKIANLLGRRRRARMEEDLHRELRYHFDRRVEDLRAAGIAEGEARRRVAIEMGGIDQVQEDVRETWTWRWLEDAIRDARYAARSLARSPGFTATAVLSLAIGVGASAAIFSLVDQVLFRLLPVREPERLVAVDWNGNSLSYGWGPGAYMSYPLCRDLMKQDRFFDGVLCRFPTVVMLASGEGPQAEPVGAEIVSGSYFPVLGVVPAMGRHLDEQDDVQPGAHPVVVLSHAYWQTALGGAPDVVGRKVLLNGFPMTVVGVASPRFRGMDIGEAPAVWIPASMKAQATPEWDRLLDRRAGFMQVFGRLRPGVGADEAQAGLLPWFKTMLDEDMRREGFPKVTAEERAQFLASTITVRPAPLGRSNFRQRMDRPLVVLMAATLFLLLLASLNVASLSLARAAARSREIRTRIALGASRVRIATLLLADSLLVALAGGSLGLLVAPLVSRSLLSFLPQEAAGVGLSPAMDGRVFVFAFLVSAVAGVSCAMAPAWQAGRVSLIGSLNQRWSGGADVRARKALVVAQIAFTLTLLVGAGLFVQTLARLVGQGPGFETAHVVTFGLNLKRVGYSQENAQRATQRILAELRSLPEVAGLGVAGNTLLQGENWSNFLTVEAGRRFVTDRPVDLNPVTPGFFATLGTRVIAGRDFDGRDARPAGETGGPRSAVVNESFARRYFPRRQPRRRPLGAGRPGGRARGHGGRRRRPRLQLPQSPRKNRAGVPAALRRDVVGRLVLPEGPRCPGVLAGLRPHRRRAGRSGRTPHGAADLRRPGGPLPHHRAHAGHAVDRVRRHRVAPVGRGALWRDGVRRHQADDGDRRAHGAGGDARSRGLARRRGGGRDDSARNGLGPALHLGGRPRGRGPALRRHRDRCADDRGGVAPADPRRAGGGDAARLARSVHQPDGGAPI